VIADGDQASIAVVRIFPRDCQEWGWCARHFDPARARATRAAKAQIAPNPRVIANDAWTNEHRGLRAGRSAFYLVDRS
jgi:hypothetical protein